MVIFENEFDDFVRNKLNNFISPLPEDMWERINPKKDKDRKLFFFWTKGLFGSILLFASLIVLYFVFAPNKIVESVGKIHSVSVQTKDNKQSADVTNNLTPKLNADKTNRIDKLAEANDPTIAQKSFAQQSDQSFKAQKKSVTQSSSENAKLDDRLTSNPKLEIKNQDKNYITEKTTNNFLEKDTDLSLNNESKIKTNNGPDSNSSINKTFHKDFSQKKLSTNKTDSVAKILSKKTGDESTSKNSRWDLDVYGSPDIVFLNRINITDPFFGQFVSLYKLQPSYTFGFRLSKLFGKHFSTKIGLQYSRINDKFTPDYPSTSFTNHLNSLDMPLLIGYETGNDNFKIAINAGAIFNIDSWYNQTTFDSAGMIYKKHTGASLYIGLDLAKKINEKISLFIEPYFRYRLSNMAIDDQAFTEKIDVGGVSLGVRYRFKKQ